MQCPNPLLNTCRIEPPTPPIAFIAQSSTKARNIRREQMNPIEIVPTQGPGDGRHRPSSTHIGDASAQLRNIDTIEQRTPVLASRIEHDADKAEPRGERT